MNRLCVGESCGAGDGDRTHVLSLGSSGPTIERHPLFSLPCSAGFSVLRCSAGTWVRILTAAGRRDERVAMRLRIARLVQVQAEGFWHAPNVFFSSSDLRQHATA